MALPCSSERIVYWAWSIFSAAALFVSTCWTKARRSFPRMRRRPMWDTSKMPHLLRHQRCSAMMPVGYWIGMYQPPKSTIVAPAAMWASQRTVFFSSLMFFAPYLRSRFCRSPRSLLRDIPFFQAIIEQYLYKKSKTQNRMHHTTLRKTMQVSQAFSESPPVFPQFVSPILTYQIPFLRSLLHRMQEGPRKRPCVRLRRQRRSPARPVCHPGTPWAVSPEFFGVFPGFGL